MSYSDGFQTSDDLAAADDGSSGIGNPGPPPDDSSSGDAPAPDDGFTTSDQVAAQQQAQNRTESDSSGDTGIGTPGAPPDDGFQTTDQINPPPAPDTTADTTSTAPTEADTGIGIPGTPPGDPTPAKQERKSPWDQIKEIGGNIAGEVQNLPLVSGVENAANNFSSNPLTDAKNLFTGAVKGGVNLLDDTQEAGNRAMSVAALDANDLRRGEVPVHGLNPVEQAYYIGTGEQPLSTSDTDYAVEQSLTRGKNPLGAVIPTSGNEGAGPQVVPDGVPVVGGDSLFDLPVVGGLARGAATIKDSFSPDARANGPSIDTTALATDLDNGMSVGQVEQKYQGSIGAKVLGDLLNPANYALEIPGMADVVGGLFTTKTQNALEDVTKTAADQGAWSPEANAAQKEILANRGKVFDQAGTNAAQTAADTETALMPGIKEIDSAQPVAASLESGAARLISGDTDAATVTAQQIADTYGGTVEGNLAHMQSIAEGAEYDAQSSLAAGKPPPNIAAILDARAETIRALGSDPAAQAIQEAAQSLPGHIDPATASPETLKQLAAIASHDIVSADVRAAKYAAAGVKLPENANVAQQGMTGVFNLVRGLMLAASAPKLAIQKFTDEWFRAATEGVRATRPSDTIIGQNLGFKGGTVAKDFLGQGVVPPESLRRSVLNPADFRGAATGTDRYGRPLAPRDRLNAGIGAATRGLNKFNDALIAQPTQHVRLNAAHADLRTLPALRQSLATRARDAILATGDPRAGQVAQDIYARLSAARTQAEFLRITAELDAMPALHGIDQAAATISPVGYSGAPQFPHRSEPSVLPTGDVDAMRGIGREGAPSAAAPVEEPPLQRVSPQDLRAWQQAESNYARAERAGDAQGMATFRAQLERFDPTLADEPSSWYHGSGNDFLSPDQLHAERTDPGGLFGPGMYLTDNPDVAQGYAATRARQSANDVLYRTGRGVPETPTVYKMDVNAQRTLDLEQPAPDDVRAIFAHQLPGMDAIAADPKATTQDLYAALKRAGRDTFSDYYADVNKELRQAGYDSLTHTGGKRVGTVEHRVLIGLEPQANPDLIRGMEPLGRAGAPSEPSPFAARGAAQQQSGRDFDPGGFSVGDQHLLPGNDVGASLRPFEPRNIFEGIDGVGQTELAYGGGNPSEVFGPTRAGEPHSLGVHYDTFLKGGVPTTDPALADAAQRYAADKMAATFGDSSTTIGTAGAPVAPQAPQMPQNPFAGAAGTVRGLGQEFAAQGRTTTAAGIARGNRIVGNNLDQTGLGQAFKNGVGGVIPPVLPFAPFHIHSAQFWAQYFAAHPALALGMGQVLQNLDDYGTLHLAGGQTVAGLVNTVTGFHVLDWAKKAYDYHQAVARQGNNNFLQSGLKDLQYNTVGNNAFVRPFDYVSSPLTALTQDVTHPLMSGKNDFATGQPLVDNRDMPYAYGSEGGVTGLGETLNDLLGGRVNRGLIQDATNPGQWLGNQLQKVTDNLPALGIDRKAYSPASAEAHTLGLIADNMGLSKYDAEKAYYNPKTPAEIALGQQLHRAVNMQMDTTAIGKVAPVQVAPAETPMQAKGVFEPNKASSYELDHPISGGFTVRDFLNQPGNLFDLDAQLREATAAGDQQKMKDIERAIAGVKARDLATHPEVKGYLDASKAQSIATYGDTSVRGKLAPNEQQAYDAFNDLRASADYKARNDLETRAAAVAAGKNAPVGSAEHNAYTAFYKENGDELTRLNNIVNGAEQSIVDRYSVNPRALANRIAATEGKPPTYADITIPGQRAPFAPDAGSTVRATGSGRSGYTPYARGSSKSTSSRAAGGGTAGYVDFKAEAKTTRDAYFALDKAGKAQAYKDGAVQRALAGTATATDFQTAQSVIARAAKAQSAGGNGNGALAGNGGNGVGGRFTATADTAAYMQNANRDAAGNVVSFGHDTAASRGTGYSGNVTATGDTAPIGKAGAPPTYTSAKTGKTYTTPYVPYAQFIANLHKKTA